MQTLTYIWECEICDKLGWEEIITIYRNKFVLDGSKTTLISIKNDLKNYTKNNNNNNNQIELNYFEIGVTIYFTSHNSNSSQNQNNKR